METPLRSNPRAKKFENEAKKIDREFFFDWAGQPRRWSQGSNHANSACGSDREECTVARSETEPQEMFTLQEHRPHSPYPFMQHPSQSQLAGWRSVFERASESSTTRCDSRADSSPLSRRAPSCRSFESPADIDTEFSDHCWRSRRRRWPGMTSGKVTLMKR